jgi:toxin YoeB
VKVSFSSNGWDDYLWWQAEDRKTLKRINKLIESIDREGPGVGLGKPEPLRGDLSGFWSRRITEEHRLVYTVEAGEVLVAQCRFHY